MGAPPFLLCLLQTDALRALAIGLFAVYVQSFCYSAILLSSFSFFFFERELRVPELSEPSHRSVRFLTRAAGVVIGLDAAEHSSSFFLAAALNYSFFLLLLPMSGVDGAASLA